MGLRLPPNRGETAPQASLTTRQALSILQFGEEFCKREHDLRAPPAGRAGTETPPLTLGRTVTRRIDRRRALQIAFSAVFIIFLLVLAYHFKPKVEVPPPARPDTVKTGTEGTLSAEGFHYRQETEGKVDYTITADTVTEARDGTKKLTKPVLSIPHQGKAWGDKGSFAPDTKQLRIWENAAMSHEGGWLAHATGFRLTPEGEVVSESAVTFSMGRALGSAELMRYNRHTQVAHLEGHVDLVKGSAHLTCRAIAVNLATHRGAMDGPVRVTSGDAVLRAPRGTLVLTNDNEIRRIVLGSPASGESGPNRFTSKTAAAVLGHGGRLLSVHLDGDTVVDSEKTPRAYRLDTASLDLVPRPGGLWHWTAPDALTIATKDGEAHAVSGTGTFGGKKPMNASLKGPIRGRQQNGTFTSDDAELAGDDWTLTGHALVVKPDERLSADTITRHGNGETTAKGHVSGSRSPEGEPTVTFTSDAMRSAEGGYPALLTGSVTLVRGDMTLTAPRVKAPDARTIEGQDGATAVFRDVSGASQTVTGRTLTYDGTRHIATADGDARGKGKNYSIRAGTLVARLDRKDSPLSYEAQGDCRFDGTAYSGEGDRLTYDPSSRSGRASSAQGDATITQKHPYHRVSGPTVVFSPRHLDVLERKGGLSRGTLEGVQPPGGSAGRKEKTVDG